MEIKIQTDDLKLNPESDEPKYPRTFNWNTRETPVSKVNGMACN
jgi:hypothetical protein